MTKIHVRPAWDGAIVRDPATMRPLPAAGAEVVETTYWRRRIAAGDVIVVATVEPKQAKGKQQKTTHKEGDA